MVRNSISGGVGCRFDPLPQHTKGDKNGTGCSQQRVVSERYKKAGKYL